MHVVVLLGDPRLPYPYNLSHRYEDRDFAAVESLRNALSELSEYRFTYLDDHTSLIDDLKRERPPIAGTRCRASSRDRHQTLTADCSKKNRMPSWELIF